MDFMKAFDFVNRPSIIENLVEKGCGKRFIEAISKTHTKSTYQPKVSNQRSGDSIESQYGVI